MKKIIIFIALASCTLLSSSAEPSNWVAAKRHIKSYPIYVSGVNIAGASNVTEPRPKKSSYLETLAGGIILIERGAGFFLNVKILKEPESKLYFKIEYPNPANPSKPLINDIEYEEGMVALHLSSPDVIWGLKGYARYTIKVSVFSKKSDSEPIETLTQSVRSYVDTQDNEILIFKRTLQTLKNR
jgi:hypothetical protein